jgi:hypothetical protein
MPDAVSVFGTRRDLFSCAAAYSMRGSVRSMNRLLGDLLTEPGYTGSIPEASSSNGKLS